jgi:hypothetical protein
MKVMLFMKKVAAGAYNHVLQLMLSASRSFLTFHRRPRFAKEYGRVSTTPPPAQTAVVMQGPIITEGDFTLETVRLYKKIFPGMRLVLSTWDDTDPAILAPLRECNIELVLNTKPPHAGISNVNLQIFSTTQGLHKAQELGAEYVLKTRTDQRLYAPDTLAYLHGLLKTFPLQQKTVQKQRLVAASLNTFKYRPYSISDMFLFGHIDDMLCYWDVPFDERLALPYVPATLIEYAKQQICEVYFVTRFMRLLGHEPTFSLADSWRAYRDYFCIIDQQSVDLYWYKYDREKEYRRLRYEGTYTDEELTFREWLLLYANQQNPAPEFVLKQPFESKIHFS